MLGVLTGLAVAGAFKHLSPLARSSVKPGAPHPNTTLRRPLLHHYHFLAG